MTRVHPLAPFGVRIHPHETHFLPLMANSTVVAKPATSSLPDSDLIDRVSAFAREPFVVADEQVADALAPGSMRRQAFDDALGELNSDATEPSQRWRRRWSLLLGLDRVLRQDSPVLEDGTTLNPHQVDALSGTYAALLGDAARRAGNVADADGAPVLSFDDGPLEVADVEIKPAVEPEPSDEDADEADDLDDDDDEITLDAEIADLPEAVEDDEDDDDAALDSEPDIEELPEEEPEPEFAYDDVADEDVDEDIDSEALNDPNAHKRFWFEHATGAGKTVAAMGFVESCRSGGILILTHRRNLVDQFIAELQTRGYGARLSKPLLGDADSPNGPVTIETYQWFVRNAGQISGAYTVVICDEAHTALGDKTSGAIRAWTGPIFIGMTATGALIARHVTDLFPTQTSRFDLAQAARRGVISPLRCLRIPPGPGVRTIAKVPLRKGEVDMEFDQDELAQLLDQVPFNFAIADLYKTRFRNTPGVVYTAGVQHAYNVAEAFRAAGMKAQAVSGETPKRELATILASYEAGEIDVLVNAQLLAEGWNSPRATVCMHLAPTASKRIYQQRVGRVTRRQPGKEAGVVIDFVHPATTHDDPVVTLHSLLDRDVYRGGAIVVGPVRRGRGRRVKVERRVLPVTPDIERRRQVFERELWRIAVDQLDWGEQRVWAALAGAKASPANWRRARAMLNSDTSGELRHMFLVTALERNRNPQLRLRAVQEISQLGDADAFDTAVDQIGQWPRDERREASRILLQAMADRRIGRRDQATAWIWRLASWTRDLHEEYAAQRWPATKHLLGLLVNSSGQAHARNARRLVHAARQHDRRLQAALLAAAVAHSPEAEEVLRDARTRLARKPGALSRDLLKDFPRGKRKKKRNRRRRGNRAGNAQQSTVEQNGDEQAPALIDAATGEQIAPAENGSGSSQQTEAGENGQTRSNSRTRNRRRRRGNRSRQNADRDQQNDANAPEDSASSNGDGDSSPNRNGQASSANESSSEAVTEVIAVKRRTRREPAKAADSETKANTASDTQTAAAEAPAKRRTRSSAAKAKPVTEQASSASAESTGSKAATPKPKRAKATAAASDTETSSEPKPRATAAKRKPAATKTAAKTSAAKDAAKATPKRATKPKATATKAASEAEAKPKRSRANTRAADSKES